MGGIARLALGALLGSLLLVTTAVVASGETQEEKEAREMREMQKALNAEVIAKPFSVEEMTKIEAYIAEANQKSLVPQPYRGTQPWLPGMTCAHLRGYYACCDWLHCCRYHGRDYPYP